MTVVLLDGPMGTELARRGADTRGPLWSARALVERPDLVGAIHADYAAAGATVHTTATFRTQRRHAGPEWRSLVHTAVRLARDHVPVEHRVAGSLAPLMDCYQPERSPSEPGPEHAELADALAEEGVDLLLVETFPHVGEAVAAVQAAVRTGLPVWCALTAGYRADLLSPAELAAGARAVAEAGAEAVLVNCVPTARTLHYLSALPPQGVRLGAYANAGSDADGIGWDEAPEGPARYLEHARTWVAAGATLIGGCCGTGPAHIAALREGLNGPLATPQR